VEAGVTRGDPASPGRAGMDLLLAVDRPLERRIDRVAAEYGYDEHQAFVIVSLAVQLRVSMIVTAPNCTVTAALPTSIFDLDGA
jgi:acetamidase/formamidase